MLPSQNLSQSTNDVAVPSSDKVLLAYHLDKGNSQFTIQGTSSLHDWEMVSESIDGSFERYDTADESINIQSIDVSVPVKSLVSGKRIMDKKCHAALKFEDHPKISYRFKSIENMNSTGNGTYTATFSGQLTVAGQTNTVKIEAHIDEVGNKIHITGQKPLKMSDFDVIPPKALLGTLKTGNEITIVFNLNYLKS